MPPVLKAKTLGLPRWAWLAIITSGVGLGLYLRSRSAAAQTEGEGEGEGEAGEAVPSAPLEQGYGYDSQNPCDPSSSAYNPSACGNQGGGYFYDGTEGSGQSYYNQYPEVTPEPTPIPPSVVVNIASPTLPSATDGTTAPKPVGPCSGAKPNVPAGYKLECKSGKWTLVGNRNGKTTTPTPAPKTGTGGGAPDKPNNKTAPTPAAPVAPAVNKQGTAPQNNAQHPAAVNTGNLCVNGGIGKHTAPAGYHLFCQGGWIWRAPNN